MSGFAKFVIVVSSLCAILLTLYVPDVHSQICPTAKLNSYQKKRFNRETLKRLCKRTVHWNSNAKKRNRKALDQLLTKKQLNYFNTVKYCDSDCLCEKHGACGGGDKGRRKRQTGFGRSPPVTRREYRMLTDDQRDRLHRALNALKNNRIDNMSKYEILVVYHTPQNAPGAHFGPAFLPFHRELLKYLEVALRIEDPSVAIPYWDSTLDQGLPNPVDSVMWSDNFLGNPRGPVTSGPFAGWRVYDHPRARQQSPSLQLVRNAGGSRVGSLYRPRDIQQIQNTIQNYASYSFCLNPFFEMVHGAVHIWVGGIMDPLEASPNDPVFFMLHAFVDKLWEDFRQNRQNSFARQNNYATNQQACNSFHFRNAQMRPFNKRNIDGLSEEYTQFFYNYEPTPSCGFNFDQCSSTYLFCHRQRGRCMSKVRPGGNCQGLQQYDSCAYGRCINGRCNAFANPPRPRPQVRRTLPPRTRAPTFPPTRRSPPRTEPPPTEPVRDTVWFPVTVHQYRNRLVNSVRRARIRTTVFGTGQVLTGEIAQTDNYPFYVGAALAQIPNPARQRGSVRVRINAQSAGGQDCKSFCYEGGNRGYVECNIVMRFNQNRRSVPVAYTPYKEQASYLSWNGPERKPDKYYFLCPSANRALPALEELGSANVLGFSKPSETSGGPRITVAGCFNKHRCCRLWQSVGECERNSIYHRENCPAACGVCSANSRQGCFDRSEECPRWRNNGECDRNPEWMDENCPRSCNACGRTLAQLRPLCGAPEGRGCGNFNDRCVGWSRSGECNTNVWWMSQNCPLACNQCTKKSKR